MLKNERAQESIRAREKRGKLERIEAAARKLFKRKGYEATTTRELAEAAGIGMGTLFVYFPEKLDLLIHLYDQDLSAIVKRSFDALPSGVKLAEGCAHVFAALYAFFERDQDLARSFCKEMVFRREAAEGKLRLTRQVYITRLMDLVTAGQARGEIVASAVPPAIAYQLFGIYYWNLVAWLGGEPVAETLRDMLMRSSLDNLARGLAPQSGGEKS